jgi:hypothetical protein
MLNQRKRHLAKLRSQLLTPPPSPKTLKRRAKSSTNLRPGDVGSFLLDRNTAVVFCVLDILSDRGGDFAHICILGRESGDPFMKEELRLEDTLGPHYTMLSQEPSNAMMILRRGVRVPAQVPESFRAWNNLAVTGHATTWNDFPAAVRAVLPKLGWV